MSPKALHNITRWNLALTGVMIAVCAVLFPRPVLVGVAIGSLLACANFWAIHQFIRIAMGTAGRARALFQMLLMLKMGVMIFLVFLALRHLEMSPAAFAVGLSVFLISIAIESVRYALDQKAPDGRA